MKNCAECKNSYQVDTGYSNWTVEGTDIYCRFNLNPACPFDRWYEQNKDGKFAERCDLFIEGEPWFTVDVEQEEVANLTSEQRAVWEQA